MLANTVKSAASALKSPCLIAAISSPGFSASFWAATLIIQKMTNLLAAPLRIFWLTWGKSLVLTSVLARNNFPVA